MEENGQANKHFESSRVILSSLKQHRHKAWRIAASILASLTVVGTFIGMAQAGIQKIRGKNPDYLFMTMTASAQKAEKVLSDVPRQFRH